MSIRGLARNKQLAPMSIMMDNKIEALLPIIATWLLLGCSSTYKCCTFYENLKGADSLEIHEGILSKAAQKIDYKKDGKTVAVIKLSEPVMVAMAEQDEDWGYFQFPSIGKSDDGTLVVSWQMKEDSPVTYGRQSTRSYKPMMSKDGGKTWVPQDRKYTVRRVGNYARLRNGTVLQAATPAATSVKSLKRTPLVVGRARRYSYYSVEDLPEDLRGAYISFQTNGTSELIHCKVNDPGLLRSSYDGLISVMWKGSIKQLADESLVAGVYPTYYKDNQGAITSGVSFYQSFDNGLTWDVIGKVPFVKDGIADVRGGSSFDEPTFEILADSTFLCVMRTGASSPMYKTLSYDRGHTWTKPEPFTPNGVKPCLMTLNNGVLVLSSGRPGVQLRFSVDGTGVTWTEPIEMVSFMNADGSYTRDVSCGYTSLIEAGDDTFYVVYSDFTTKNKSGNTRKSIWCREIRVEKGR
mgnify:CR=1 FL=1